MTRARRKDWESVEAKMERLSIPEPNSGCYLWLGQPGTGGYAYVDYREGRKRFYRKAATVALELAGKPRPEGLEVSHICDNRVCVNPDHLIWETHLDNMRRRKWTPKGVRYVVDCKHCGEPKTQIFGNRTEWVCLACRAKRAKEWRERTGYDFNDYYAENKDRINAQRRKRRGSK